MHSKNSTLSRGPRGPTPSGFAYEIYKSHDLKIDL